MRHCREDGLHNCGTLLVSEMGFETHARVEEMLERMAMCELHDDEDKLVGFFDLKYNLKAT